MALKRKIHVKSLEDAESEINVLTERVEALEKALKIVYHRNTTAQRRNASSMYDVGDNIANAQRQLTQVSKVQTNRTAT